MLGIDIDKELVKAARRHLVEATSAVTTTHTHARHAEARPNGVVAAAIDATASPDLVCAAAAAADFASAAAGATVAAATCPVASTSTADASVVPAASAAPTAAMPARGSYHLGDNDSRSGDTDTGGQDGLTQAASHLHDSSCLRRVGRDWGESAREGTNRAGREGLWNSGVTAYAGRGMKRRIKLVLNDFGGEEDTRGKEGATSVGVDVAGTAGGAGEDMTSGVAEREEINGVHHLVSSHEESPRGM